MKFKFKILALIIIITFQSCSKEEDDLSSQNCETDCTEFIGRIMTDNGTVPIPNLKLTVKWDNIPYLGSGTIRTKATTRTDSNGNFYLKFFIRDDELEDGSYSLSYEKLDDEKYLETRFTGIALYSYNIKRDTTLNINHNAPKKAFLNLTLLNLDEYQQGDDFNTYFKYLGPNGYSQTVDGLIRGWSNEFDSNQLLEVTGNQPIALQIIRQRNNMRTIVNDTIFIEAGRTFDYTIDFTN